MNPNSLYNRLFFIIINFFILVAVAQAQDIAANHLHANTIKSDKNAQEYTSITEWQQASISHIVFYKYYPCEARKNRQQGKVVVRLLLDSKGKLIEAIIIKSSNVTSLDEAAINTLKRASPYPLPPKKLFKENTLSIIVPINYNLSNNDDIQNIEEQIESKDIKKLLITLFFLINILIIH